MRWACILLPQLALDQALRQHDDPQAPLALLSGPANRRVLQTLNPAARELGLRPGMTLSAAQLLSRDFATADYDPAAVERCQQFLAAWAYRFSSQVSLHYPRTLLLEVESSLGLFGPWPRLESRLRSELDELGYQRRIVLAPNPAAARALANAYDGLAVNNETALARAIGQLPVQRAGLSRDEAEALTRMGLRQVHKVLQLPRETLARRFPASLLEQLDRLLGRRPLGLDFYLPPDEFSLRIELNFEVESHQALLFPLRRALGDLAAYLAGRDSGVQRFTLTLEHRSGAPTELQVGLLGAERDPNMLFELTRTRLERLQLPAPVLALRLVARDLPAFVPERRELFDPRPQQNLGWEQLRERLRARLGDDALHGLGAHADPRPEHAWRPQAGKAPLEVRPRPGWLLAEPQALREPPRILLAGPERIESGWWDGGDLRRDYYRAELRNGQQAWVFQEPGADGTWWLHGWFA
ncbi:Y-family DNA polymerase [Pseudomonas sp. Gutcm_11s]|uniref:Y-family DNA polymerase n=1 Tax=Pseudomonas sp. Gutcm_11s TaxID=3026088 RepID=UPI0023610FA8|nr:DNA polymerase Y family protein [Pseudomonas sp. Gutcm_11s]MDD0843744.1 DNA polymerase Y family protein [Pseudomonas sp. Gutcm_11s]